jgi:prepilin-type N-terminal cleavage/methylation domain-containing protein
MNRRRIARRDRGFTLLEVVVSLMIVSMAVVGLHSSLGGAVDKAMTTKVNRQLRHLAQFQYGQLVVGKLHPEEQDPFLDGQTGDFADVGGYPEEYSRFTWELKVEEYAVTGASTLDLEEAGFTDDGTGSYSRPLTDDLVAATSPEGGGGGGGFGALMRGEAPRPEGQFRRRITLRVHWAAEKAEDDRSLTLVTLVPVDGEGAGELPGGLAGGGAADGAGAGAAGDGGAATGGDRTGGRTLGGGR